MKCERVTITGADDSTDIGQLVDWSGRFPFVEWGILISKSQEGSERFPSRRWIDEFSDAARQHGMAVSAHLCGRWVRQLLAGELDWREVPMVVQLAQRIQINTHADLHQWRPGPSRRNMLELGAKVVIFQEDGLNAAAQWAAALTELTASTGALLYDTSGGAGVLPGSWPEQSLTLPCGYAGGLGPDNVVEQIGKIEAVTTRPYWIDMERRVRVPDDTRLDEVAVFTVLEQVDRLMRASAAGSP